MKEIQTVSTSSKTADCDPILLRSKSSVRLLFFPTMVDNAKNPAAGVRGSFIYQKKNKSAEWAPNTEHSLRSLKSGEGYKLELHCDELYTLMQRLGQVYRLQRQEGIPKGRSKWVKTEAGLSRFLELGQAELRDFLSTHSDEAAGTLLTLIRWVAGSREGSSALSEISASELPSLTALLGLSAIKNALKYWSDHELVGDEEFWQKALFERAYVLSQVYAYPVIIIKPKAYLGGKQFDNTGGKLVDFLLKTESTGAALLVEVKTPTTRLLGPRYRDDVYPFSTDLTGAIAQALSYQRSLGLDFRSIAADGPKKLLMGEPRCLVIAGNMNSEFTNEAMRVSFELQRERLQGVTVISYDELFLKVRRLVELLDKTSP